MYHLNCTSPYLPMTLQCCLVNNYPSFKTLLNVTSNELQIVFDWFIANKLRLNVKKTHFMLLSTGLCGDYTTMTIANCVLKKVHSTKFLGVVLFDKLYWREHIELLHIKLSKSIGMLKSASLYMPHDVLLLFFYAFFNDQLHFGLLIWGNTYLSYLTPIKTLYKRCIRLLSYEHPYAHTPPLALQLEFLFLMIFLLISQLFLCSK